MSSKKLFLPLLSALVLCPWLKAAAPLDSRLQEKTLRVDYVFSGTDKQCDIAVDELCVIDGWAGRRVNMSEVPLRGNGQVRMKDAATGDILYAMSFSTLFQEWQATEEASRVRKSFENVFLLPMPSVKVEISVELYDFFGNVAASLTHPVDPSDILIRPKGRDACEYSYIHRGGSTEDCIDIVVVAEGYTKDEIPVFYEDAKAAFESFMNHEPFASMRDRLNFIAVPLVSEDSGASIPKQGIWKNTALSSSFDTFYSDRYLTTLRLRQMHDALAGIPYEHIIILANTDNYGGGGVYNSYTLTTAHHNAFKPVVVHEFGHSFGGLADEYYYDDQYTEMYYPEAEPWEQNITTMKDFASKWEDMMGKDGVGLHEGGGYQSKGVWRPTEDCRMKTNSFPEFCPVCQRAVERMIRFYTE